MGGGNCNKVAVIPAASEHMSRIKMSAKNVKYNWQAAELEFNCVQVELVIQFVCMKTSELAAWLGSRLGKHDGDGVRSFPRGSRMAAPGVQVRASCGLHLTSQVAHFRFFFFFLFEMSPRSNTFVSLPKTSV